MGEPFYLESLLEGILPHKGKLPSPRKIFWKQITYTIWPKMTKIWPVFCKSRHRQNSCGGRDQDQNHWDTVTETRTAWPVGGSRLCSRAKCDRHASKRFLLPCKCYFYGVFLIRICPRIGPESEDLQWVSELPRFTCTFYSMFPENLLTLWALTAADGRPFAALHNITEEKEQICCISRSWQYVASHSRHSLLQHNNEKPPVELNSAGKGARNWSTALFTEWSKRWGWAQISKSMTGKDANT